MLVSYRAVLARPGARRLALACALGWLSFAAYGLAGAHALAMALLVAACLARWPAGALVGAAAVAGACVPPFIATARAVWPSIAGDELTRTGHALNAALGDAGQVAGPALVGGVAALAASAAAALALLIPGVAVGAALLVSVSGRGAIAGPAPAPARGARRRSLLAGHRGLRAIVAVELLLGVAFGALDVAAPAVADGAGAAALGALPLAAFALGSVLASLWSGAGRTQRPPADRYRAGCVAFALAVAPVLALHGLAAVTLLLIVAGAGYGVLNVAVFELLERVVPPSRAVEAFTWLTTFAGAGMAAGAALAGQLAAHALTVLALAAVAAALAALWQRVEP